MTSVVKLVLKRNKFYPGSGFESESQALRTDALPLAPV